MQLLPTILLAPALTLALPPLELGVPYSQLFERGECGGPSCGWNGQLCCSAGQGCFTDASNQAQCTAGGTAETAAAAGEWAYSTTTYVETDLQTITSTISSYLGGGWAQPTSGACDYASNETPCGDTCCKSSEYCYTQGHCKPAANGDSSAYYSSYYSTMYETTNAAGVPLRPTSSTLIIVTETGSPTTTVAFETPVATGAEVGLTESEGGSGGLSGGAIAGIVIGTLAGLALLGFLCFYCCVRGLFAGFLALFGGGKKKRRTEVDEYERYSHHGSGRHSNAGGRTWYGAAARPSRPERKEDSTSKKLLGVGAGLAGLWAILGLKRRQNRRDDEKYSEYSYSSDYYTNTSATQAPTTDGPETPDARARDDDLTPLAFRTSSPLGALSSRLPHASHAS
ncbi:hypothetical protein Q7P35_010128 [Cladosporium inversicolor]